MAELFKDYLNLEIKDVWGKETMNKTTLHNLERSYPGAGTFLQYRKHEKLSTAFFPRYLDLHREGSIHCNFNPTGTP